jgi:pimeloyl-ACP methyl ester carboxylesterase
MNTVAVKKPVVVLIHGAFHRPVHFLNLILQLENAGYPTTAPALPSCGWDADVSSASLDDATNAVNAAVKPYLDDGREILLVGHSLGGIIMTEVAVGETVDDRKRRGERGGVAAVLFLAAYASRARNVSAKSVTYGDAPVDPAALPDWFELKVNPFTFCA